MTPDEFSNENMRLRDAIAAQEKVVDNLVTQIREETDKLVPLRQQLAELHLERSKVKPLPVSRVNTRVDLDK